MTLRALIYINYNYQHLEVIQGAIMFIYNQNGAYRLCCCVLQSEMNNVNSKKLEAF